MDIFQSIKFLDLFIYITVTVLLGVFFSQMWVIIINFVFFLLLQGGCSFIITGSQPLQDETYEVKFGSEPEYGVCSASLHQECVYHLHGSQAIPEGTFLILLLYSNLSFFSQCFCLCNIYSAIAFASDNAKFFLQCMCLIV